MTIRLATTADAFAIRSIYSQYINTPITFETALPSNAEFVRRIATTLARYPYLVYTQRDKIVGYAYASALSPRDAYQWASELSVYVDSAAYGAHIGHLLYKNLMTLLAFQNVVSVYGCVCVPNAASDHLHQAFEFKTVGTFPHAGYKNGKWYDVRWYQRDLGDPTVTPKPFIPFVRLNQQSIKALLAASGKTV